MPDGGPPVEHSGGRRSLTGPQHPGGEDAVEEGLYQGGAEEGGSPVSLELHAQRFLQRLTHGIEGLGCARGFNPGEPVTGVGSQDPGQVARLGQLRTMGQGAAQVLAEGLPDVLGEGPGVLEPLFELAGGTGQPEGLQLDGLAVSVLPQEDKVPGVGDQDQPVVVPVLADLDASRGEPGIVADRFDLHHTAFRGLALLDLALLELVGGVEGPGRGVRPPAGPAR